MKNNWAENFYEIIKALRINKYLLENVKRLITTREIIGMSLADSSRKKLFKNILSDLSDGNIGLEESYNLLEYNNNQKLSVFCRPSTICANDWRERLIRINLSKFYNQAVLLYILNRGEKICFIPHSKYERCNQCSSMAGKVYDALDMLIKIENVYEKKIFHKEFKIPAHPYCTHVIMPVENKSHSEINFYTKHPSRES